MSGVNVHDPQYREVKPQQGGPSTSLTDLFRLDGRTIVITGASGFLGNTVAVLAMESGADVVALDIVKEPPKNDWAPVEEAAEKFDAKLWYYQVDVTEDEAVLDIFSKLTVPLRYPIRGLVACAGVSLNGPAVEFPTTSFRRLMDINVTGTFSVAQAVAKEMKKADVSGSMVLVASMSGYGANKGVDTAGYNSSKAAVHQLARSLAAEWGSRIGMPLIRVNTLSPGYIRTAATAEALQKPGMETQWTSDNMLNRLSKVDEFRGPILYLLADASSFMTGADLRMDGGHCAW